MRATLRRLVREGEVLPRATPDTVLLHLPHNAAPLLSLVLACDASGRSSFCFLRCLRVVFWEWASRSIVHWDWRFAHERFIFSFARGVSYRQVCTGGGRLPRCGGVSRRTVRVAREGMVVSAAAAAAAAAAACWSEVKTNEGQVR